MTESRNFNLYNDTFAPTVSHHGVDIASQRADDLDQMAIARVSDIGGPVWALDVGSAAGGQAIRLAAAGADVIAIDLDDYRSDFLKAAALQGVEQRCVFFQADIVTLDLAVLNSNFDIIVCQRMIHYLPYQVAVGVLKRLSGVMAAGGRIYLSASGLDSELGQEYSGAGMAVERRYTPLSEVMRAKHAIHGAVCLYRQHELGEMIRSAGLVVEKLFASPFGNIKAVAKRG